MASVRLLVSATKFKAWKLENHEVVLGAKQNKIVNWDALQSIMVTK